METPVVDYIHIQLGSLLATLSLMRGGGSLRETLDEFVHYFGVPEHLTFDGFQYQVRKNTKNGKPLGVGTSNPITDTRLYEVWYLDGTVKNLAANVIDENLLSQVYQEGHHQLLIDEITDHRKDLESIE